MRDTRVPTTFEAAAAHAAAVNAAEAVAMATTTASSSAARAAAHEASTTHQDRASKWTAVGLDISTLMVGQAPDELMRRPLWHTHGGRVGQAWTELKRILLSLDERWRVWTDWYDDILRGADHPDSRPLIENLEVARVLIPDSDWAMGSSHINALIADLEIKYRAQTPAQRPAIIEVETGDDDRLHRVPSRSPIARDAPQEQRLRSAWAAHSEQLLALEALDPGRNSPGLSRALADYRRALGTAYEALDVIALGVHGTRIESHAARADERLMEDAAGELASLAASHSLFIRQFPAWREYLADAADEPTDEVVAAAVSVAHSAPAFAELIAEDVTEPLVALAEAARPGLSADPEERPTAAVKGELIKSVGNVLSGLFAPLLAFARDHGTAARQGSLDGTRDFSKQATQALLFASTAQIATLIAGLPAEFGWLAAVLAFLKMKFKP